MWVKTDKAPTLRPFIGSQEVRQIFFDLTNISEVFFINYLFEILCEETLIK